MSCRKASNHRAKSTLTTSPLPSSSQILAEIGEHRRRRKRRRKRSYMRVHPETLLPEDLTNVVQDQISGDCGRREVGDATVSLPLYAQTTVM